MGKRNGVVVHSDNDDAAREVTAAIPAPDPPVAQEVRKQKAGEAIGEPKRDPRAKPRSAARREQVGDGEHAYDATQGAGDAQRVRAVLSRRGALDAEEGGGLRQGGRQSTRL